MTLSKTMLNTLFQHSVYSDFLSGGSFIFWRHGLHWEGAYEIILLFVLTMYFYIFKLLIIFVRHLATADLHWPALGIDLFMMVSGMLAEIFQ